MSENIHVLTLDRPLSFERRLSEVGHGPTIADLISIAGIPAGTSVRVSVDGDLVYPEYHRVVRPKRGAHVVIRAVARGGGQGRDKNVGMIVLGILLIVVGIALTAAEIPIGPYVIGVGVSLTLGGVINLLIPPPTPPRLRPLSGLSGQDAESPTLSIAGQRNSVRPYGVVPRVLGRHKVFPPVHAV